MEEYIKLFQNHTLYEAYKNSADYVTPNVSYCRQENETHFEKLKYKLEFDIFLTNSEVISIIDSRTQEVVGIASSTPINGFEPGVTYIARITNNGISTTTQRPSDYLFRIEQLYKSSEDTYMLILMNELLYEYNTSGMLFIADGYDSTDCPNCCTDYYSLFVDDPDLLLNDSVYNDANDVNLRFKQYAIDNNKAQYIEFYNDHGLKARIKNTATNETVNTGWHEECGDTLCTLDNSNQFILGGNNSNKYLTDYNLVSETKTIDSCSSYTKTCLVIKDNIWIKND